MAVSCAEQVRASAVSFDSATQIMPAFLKAVGDTRLVLIGEATHGTHEFYRIRAHAGELNLGQLVPERFEREALLVGFTTYAGTVTAARNWGDDAERRRVRPAIGSYERLFHDGLPQFFLPL